MIFSDPLESIFYLRQYQELASSGITRPIICPRDTSMLHTGASDDDVYMFCLECDYRLFPGSNFIDTLVAVVKEHNDATE